MPASYDNPECMCLIIDPTSDPVTAFNDGTCLIHPIGSSGPRREVPAGHPLNRVSVTFGGPVSSDGTEPDEIEATHFGVSDDDMR